jgi:DNA-binding SARP family transcriptional activator
MKFYVLGPIEIRPAAGTVLVPHGSKQRLLLALLVLHAPRVVSPERLIDILWGDDVPADPAAALRTQVSRLRALLAEAGVEGCLQRGAPSGYCLDLASADVDAGRFEDLHRRAAEAAVPEHALALAEEALALWRDEPFSEFRDTHHFLGEAARLRELWLSTSERRVQCLLALGRTGDALTAVVTLVDADPLRERSRALAMHALLPGRVGRATRLPPTRTTGGCCRRSWDIQPIAGAAGAGGPDRAARARRAGAAGTLGDCAAGAERGGGAPSPRNDAPGATHTDEGHYQQQIRFARESPTVCVWRTPRSVQRPAAR